MSSQLSLEDAARARDEGLRIVTENAGDEWVDEARRWIVEFLRENRLYLPDAAKVHGCPAPHDWRAMGAVIRWAVREGLMVREGSHRRLSGHLSEGPKYRSLICERTS